LVKKHTKEEAPPVEEGVEKTEIENAEPMAAEENRASRLEEELVAVREEVRKNWDLYLRERADLENFRKRAQRDKEDLARFANESILREILPVLDNLERAVVHARQQEGEGGGLLEGVEMTLSQLHRLLDKFGVAPIEAVGTPFDPDRHEAMGQMESAEHPPNTVVQELQKGYLLNERLLRPSLVMVGKSPAGQVGEKEKE